MSSCTPFGAAHPLDPLSPDEIRQAAGACRAYANQTGLEALRFNVITLQVLQDARGMHTVGW